MLSFRRKILFSDLILFLIFIALLFPFVGKTVGNIIRKSLEERATELINEIKTAPSEEEMVNRLKAREALLFFRVGIIDYQGRLLYEPHEQFLPENYSTNYITSRPEVAQAMKYGIGYSEYYSKVYGQTFAFMAKSFLFQGKKYSIRTAFPLKEIKELTKDFEIGFVTIGIIILVLYTIMTWAIIHRLSSPIQQIINAIKPYQEGKEEFLPKIEIKESLHPGDDFTKLSRTLNSLTQRIQNQIQTLTSQRNENESILDSLVEGVVALNAQNIITYANPKACKMLGVPKPSLLGHFFEQVKAKASPILIERCKNLVYQCQQQMDIAKTSIIVGDLQKLHLDLIAVPRAAKTGAILVLQDKTSDYRVLEMGKDFIANASHELRTPITIIRGFAETLQDLPELSPQMLKEITEKIVRTCDRLNNLVKNILTLADIDNIPSSRFHKCDLGAMVENCKHILLSVHKNAKVEINEKKERIQIFADSDLIELALMNLLENSVKYSTNTPEIVMTVDQWVDEVVLTIEDKGIGIPEPDLEHIFQRFYTVDKARSRRHGGAGLGLSIVKTIIEKHGGEITVTSKMGAGTKFTIVLPVYTKAKEKHKPD